MSRYAYIRPDTGERCCFEASARTLYCARCERLALQERLELEDWMRAVAEALGALCGLHPNDLPDCPYADWHLAGLSPDEAAISALAAFTGDD